MALQTPSPMVSSPDPLGNSQDSSYFTLTTPRRGPRTPLANSSINARSLQLQNFVLQTPPVASGGKLSSSPIRASAQTENVISPWRIRVTVEAEHDAGQENVESILLANAKASPSKSQMVRTTTTSIPLKDADSFSPRKAGRPRKNGNGTPGRKPSGTPKSRSVRGRKTLDTETEGDKAPTYPSRRSVSLKHFAITPNEGSSISSDELNLSHGDKPDLEKTPIASIRKNNTELKINKGSAKSKATRKASSPAKLVGNTPSNGRKATRIQQENSSKAAERANDPISSGPRESEETFDIGEERDEVGELPEFDSILDSEGFSMVSISSLPSAKEHLSSPAVLDENNRGAHSPLDNEFSKMSVSSTEREPYPKVATKPVNRVFRDNSDGKNDTSLLRRSSRQSSAVVCGPEQSLLLSEQGSRMLGSSTIMMSSPPRLLTLNTIDVNQTPSVAFSSPQLPPPPRQSPGKVDHLLISGGDGKLGSVILAGTSLQSVTESNPSEGSIHSSPTKSILGDSLRQEKEWDSMFGGELVRRQNDNGSKKAPQRLQPKESRIPQNAFGRGYPRLLTPDDGLGSALQKPVPHRATATKELLTPSTESDMDWQRRSPVVHSRTPSQNSATAERLSPLKDAGNDSAYSNLSVLEAQWQNERDAVIEQIRNANASQVVVIDDTVIGESAVPLPGRPALERLNTAGFDIWQAEAHIVGTPIKEDPSKLDAQQVQTRQEKGTDAQNKEQLHPSHGDESEKSGSLDQSHKSDAPEGSNQATKFGSSLFWQPTSAVKQRNARRRERRGRKDHESSEVLEPNDRLDHSASSTLPRQQTTSSSPHQDQPRANSEARLQNTATAKKQTIKPNNAKFGEPKAQNLAPQPTITKKGPPSQLQSHPELAAASIKNPSSSSASSSQLEKQPACIPTLPPTMTLTPASPPKQSQPDSGSSSGSGLFSKITSAAPLWWWKSTETTSNGETSIHSPVEKSKNLLPPPKTPLSIKGDWAIEHYKYLDELYQVSKRLPATYTPPPLCSSALRKLVNWSHESNGYRATLTYLHITLVQEFRQTLADAAGAKSVDEVQWSEGYVARRLYSIMIGEDMRRARGEKW